MLRTLMPRTSRAPFVACSCFIALAAAMTPGCASPTKASKNPTSTAIEAHSAEPNSTASSSASTTTATPTAATPTRAVRPVETFDAVWTTVRDSHFDKTLNGVDWIAVREELRPQAINAASQDELRAVLLDMLSRLGQSHFTILPGDVAEASPTIETTREQVRAPETEVASAAASAPAASTNSTTSRSTTSRSTTSSDSNTSDANVNASVSAEESAETAAPELHGPGYSGLDIALVEGETTVLRVAPDSPAAAAGVLPGWTIIAVDGTRLADALRGLREALARESDTNSPHTRQLRTELAVAGASFAEGSAGATRTLTFATADGERDVALTLSAPPLGAQEFGNLPPLPISVGSRVVEIAAPAKPIRIGVIDFNIWLTGASASIDRAVDSLRSCDGIVIDLRGNPGGLGAMSMGVAGHFLSEPASLGSMIGRDTTLEFKATPRKVSTAGKRVRPYSKPLAILVDARSASTSEVFAGGLQDLGRARVFGETSAGMALPAQAIELPNGDVLMHAVADFVTSKGTRMEGRGVIPDEVAVPTRAELLAGNDAALLAATNWISGHALAAREAKNATSPAPAAVEAASVPTLAPAAAPDDHE